MAHWICVLAVVLVVASSTVLAGFPVPKRPKTKADLEKVGLGNEELNELNENIRKYLLYFEEMRRLGTSDHVKKTMDVIKLLIVQSWVSTLEPEIGLVTFLQKKSLEDVNRSLIKAINELKEADKPLLVADYVLYYVDYLEPYITQELESEKNSFKYAKKTFSDDERKAEHDGDHQAASLISNTWEGIANILDEIKTNLMIHKIASGMYLQSYLSNVIRTQPPTDKFTITSSDSKSQKEFDTPDLGLGIYLDILKINEEFNKDIASDDQIKNDLYTQILNERIRQYLVTFDKIANDAVNKQLQSAMMLIKQLMIQGWIETMQPGETYFPLQSPATLESTRKNIINELRKQNIYSPVRDAILFYTDKKEYEIENDFQRKNDTLAIECKAKLKTLKTIKESPENEKEISKIKGELKILEEKINVENSHLIAHKICKLFYLNSYREDFINDPHVTTFKIEPIKVSLGAKVFDVPTYIPIEDFFSDFLHVDKE